MPFYGTPGVGLVPVVHVRNRAAVELAFPASGSLCYDVLVNQNVTLTITNGTRDQWQEIILITRMDPNTSFTITAPSGVLWSGGSPPTFGTTPGAVTVVRLGQSDGGLTYFGGL